MKPFYSTDDEQRHVKIPKIIHQIRMGAEEIPEALSALSTTWRELNPDWEYRLWDRTAAENLLKEHYPDFVPVYESYPCEEQRSNAVRYPILHSFGGLYVDPDCECLEPIDRLIGDSECFFGLGQPLESMFCGKPTMPDSFFMGCTPNHEFFARVTEGMMAFEDKLSVSYAPYLIESSTGRILLAKTLSAYSCPEKITLIPADPVDPLLKSEVRMVLEGTATPEIEQKIEAAYVVRYKLFA